MRDGRLRPAAVAFRTAHAVIAIGFLGAIAYVWWCALTGRRDRLLRVAVGSLVAEGAFVTANHGDCPLGPLQDRLGDPVPLFELVLSPAAAKRAVPALGAVASAGIALLARGSRRRRRPAARSAETRNAIRWPPRRFRGRSPMDRGRAAATIGVTHPVDGDRPHGNAPRSFRSSRPRFVVRRRTDRRDRRGQPDRPHRRGTRARRNRADLGARDPA